MICTHGSSPFFSLQHPSHFVSVIAFFRSCFLPIRMILTIEAINWNTVSTFFFPSLAALTDDTNVFGIQSWYRNLALPSNFNYTGFDTTY